MHNTVISKETIFSPFYGPSSDLYSRIHERNYTIIYVSPADYQRVVKSQTVL